jgi:cobalt transporter subunit CbtB
MHCCSFSGAILTAETLDMIDLSSPPLSPEAAPTAGLFRLRISAAVSMLLGALIIYGAGFAPGILHGASHDSRHTLGFVCH